MSAVPQIGGSELLVDDYPLQPVGERTGLLTGQSE